MGKRLANASSRRFFTEFESVKAGRLRALGIIDPAKNQAVIPFGDKQKLIGVSHTRFPSGGGYSFFRCPKCGRRAAKLWLVDGDLARCSKCCNAMNIKHASKYGFGRATRREAADKHLDELIAKLETKERLRLKPAPKSWGGRAQIVYNGHRLTENMQRRMISLRLSQLAHNYAKGQDGAFSTDRPVTEARQLIDLAPIWKAQTSEALAQALDKAQITILAALNSDDPQQRLNAAKLMLRTKQARQRNL